LLGKLGPHQLDGGQAQVGEQQLDGTGGASYIELYAGAGRSLITGTNQIIDGSAVVAFKAGQASGHPFSEMHLSDLEAQNSSALAQRIKALGGAATTYVGDANVVVRKMRTASPAPTVHRGRPTGTK